MTDKFGTDLAAEIGARIHRIRPDFPVDALIGEVVNAQAPGGWAGQMAAALCVHLPPDYPQALAILMRILGPPVPPEQPMPNAYKLTPVAYFIAEYGRDHFDESLAALRQVASRTYAAQVALRVFLRDDPDRYLTLLHTWVHDPDPHIRLLVSGGTRPRLRLRAMPGIALLTRFIDDPRPLLDLLAQLKNDSSYAVRHSVGGNLSDILKDNPDVAYAAMTHWAQDATRQTRQIIRRAIRLAIKKGDPRAFALAAVK